MAPNKDWMNLEDYLSEDYEKRMASFLDYTFTKLVTESIWCPHVKCINMKFRSRELVHGHLLTYAMVERYIFWYYHWETFSEPVVEMNDDDDDDDDDDIDEMQAVNATSTPPVRQLLETYNKCNKGHRAMAPDALARSRGRKLHELNAFKSHNTCFVERDTNNEVYVKSSATISESTDGSLMRHSSVRSHSSDRDPFNPIRHFSGSSNHGFPTPAPIHEDDVSNDRIDADNDDNDNASFLKNEAISSSTD
ncbi:hypothetical protein Cgig2_021679 [Carnegiea gigantea]|uniref:Transposase-associated domain-containing protein n=1 Tax=Carnegiea gigantea TaxID=171969 RepID=A0A9Q1KUA6_9CARY|nr:hypothetical protein Cgig2_021679 [Carnegiea gigantea]